MEHLHDEDLAQAIIDRVLERGRLLRLDGPSIRTLHVNLDEAMKEASDQDADLVRISGKVVRISGTHSVENVCEGLSWREELARPTLWFAKTRSWAFGR